jgi:tRNA A-37 threonylcarbamoyl transferase component Bud32
MTFAQPFSEYEILDRVGAGAMGTVFKARHKRLNRVVALKVLKPSLARDKRYVDRLRREARIVASLSHPNIVTGFDLGEEGGYHFFVMEFVEGKSLRALLSEWGTFAEDYVRRVARQVAQSLDHAYQRGVIHRDIKPGNILIDEAGNVKLTDMGLAKGPADLTLTRDGATVGTPQYISPEQARNPHDVDVRTDLYSLGATLYHMVTGVPPFRGDTMAELITNVLHELPVSPKAINSQLTDGMSLVIRKLLAKDLTVRYQTPRDLLDDLDRLERSLPPQIDPERLSEEEGERSRWWPRALLAVGLAALLGAAWWLGLEMRERDGPVVPTASEFLAELDTKLAALPTPGARLAHLRTLPQPPLGAETEVRRRQRAAEDQIDREVAAVAAKFAGDGWTRLREWMDDPAVWPDLQRVLRERVEPLVMHQIGTGLAQLGGRLGPLEQLHQSIERTLGDRDQGLLVRFEMHVKARLPALVRDRLADDDFADAERVWTDALQSFLDGVRRPLPERVSEQMRAALAERLRAAQQDGEKAIEQQESAVAAAMRAEAEQAAASLSQQLHGELPPDAVEALLRRVREDFAQRWPPAPRFRPGRNPWPDIERRLAAVDLDVQAASRRVAEQRFEGRCDLAWRTFCHGRAEDALALLAPVAAVSPAHAQRLDRHRAALAAARAVEHALLDAIRRSPQAVVAFLRGAGAETVDLRARQQGDAWVLTGSTPLQQEPRPVHLSQLHFGKLLARLQQERDPLATLAPAERALGVMVCRLAGDELAGLKALLGELAPDDRDFVVDEIWERVLTVRAERADSPIDRQSLFERLRGAREAAAKGGPLAELDNAIAMVDHGVPEAERSREEDDELRGAKTWLRTARRGEQLEQQLQRAAPRDAEIEVVANGAELVAQVALPAAALHGFARDWQLRGRALEFAGGGRPWAELEQQMLQGSAGIEPGAARTSLAIDVVFPPTAVGRRFYVVEFRGIACVVVLGANDTVHAALLDGDLRREENVQKAFAQAVDGVRAPARAMVVPGGVHRLSLELATSPHGQAAMVRVLFDGAELLPLTRRDLDVRKPVTFALHPQQDVAVTRVTVRAEGI